MRHIEEISRTRKLRAFVFEGVFALSSLSIYLAGCSRVPIRLSAYGGTHLPALLYGYEKLSFLLVGWSIRLKK